MEKRINRLRIINIITICCILILSAVLLMNYLNGKRKQVIVDMGLKARINADMSQNLTDMKVLDYLDDMYREAVLDRKHYEYWGKKLTMDPYKAVHIGTWNISDEVQEWYDHFYGDGFFEVVEHCIETPEELSDYLLRIAGSGNDVEKIVLYINPYEFYRNYLKSFALSDEQPLAFSQVLRECLLDYIVEHENFSYVINLPVLSPEYWNRLTNRELEEALECWRDLIHYSGWGNDVKVHALGTEKWVFCNRNCFGDIYPAENVEDYIFGIENTVEYLVDYDKADATVENFAGYIEDFRKRRFDLKGAKDYDLIFMGDSIMTYGSVEAMTIPGVVGGLFDTVEYNLAKHGSSCANPEDEYSFDKVAGYFAEGENRYDESLRAFGQFNDYIARTDTGKTPCFVIEYGFNDYVAGISNADYEEGLRKGIEILKDKYPEARFLILSPLFTTYENGGKNPYVKGGGTLPKFTGICKKVAEDTDNVDFLDISVNTYTDKKNADTAFADKVHPRSWLSFEVGLKVADKISEMLKD